MTDEEDINVFDEGTESAPTVNGQDEAPASPPKVDSADETTEPESTEPEKVEDEGKEGKEVSATEEEPGVEKPEKEKTPEDVLAEVDKEIANEKNSAYYRNGLKVYKQHFLAQTDAVEKTYEPLKDYGDVQKITDDLEIIKGLDSFEINKETNLPERTVKPFVEKLIDKKGFDTALQLMVELGSVRTPDTNASLFDELIKAQGLDPDRLSDYKALKANGYQMNGGNPPPDADELEQIPEEYREAYRSMTPAEREKINPYFDDGEADAAFRLRTLKAIQGELDAERATKADELSFAEKAAQDKIQEKQQFYQEVNANTQKLFDVNGAKLHTSFVESLTGAEMDEFDALNIANTLSMVLNNQGIEGTSSKAALEKIGVKLDPAIETIYGEWVQTAVAAATFEKQGDKANHGAALNRFNELQEKLERKAKPVIAAIIEHRGKVLKDRVETRNATVDKTQQFNNGIKPNEGKPSPVLSGNYVDSDFSDAAYEKIDVFGR